MNAVQSIYSSMRLQPAISITEAWCERDRLQAICRERYALATVKAKLRVPSTFNRRFVLGD